MYLDDLPLVGVVFGRSSINDCGDATPVSFTGMISSSSHLIVSLTSGVALPGL